MKKIINGKKYDTETAKRMAGYSNGCYGDLYYTSEELYKKRTGEFFLYCVGGAGTIYAKTDGNNYCSGEVISPITKNCAKEWVELYANEDYEKIFGECEE